MKGKKGLVGLCVMGLLLSLAGPAFAAGEMNEFPSKQAFCSQAYTMDEGTPELEDITDPAQEAEWGLMAPRDVIRIEKDVRFPCGVVYHVTTQEAGGLIGSVLSYSLKYRPSNVTSISSIKYSKLDGGRSVQWVLEYWTNSGRLTQTAMMYPGN